MNLAKLIFVVFDSRLVKTSYQVNFNSGITNIKMLLNLIIATSLYEKMPCVNEKESLCDKIVDLKELL